MGWEKRGNREYYYQKERIGDRVVSRYIGAGEDASLIAQLETIRREQSHLERWLERSKRSELQAMDRHLSELDSVVSALMRAVLLSEGFHTYKRQWRYRRDQQKENDQVGSR